MQARGAAVRKVPILTQENLRIIFDERDVLRACGMMRCGKTAEECIGRMIDRTMECALCYMVLRILRTPCQMEGIAFRDVQIN